MTPEESRMLTNELDMSREQLLMIILELRKKLADQEAWRSENSMALTAMAKDYQSLKAEAETLRAENAELKSALTHVSEIRQLRTNDIFGRGTEKLSDIMDAPLAREETDEAEEEPADIIDISDAAIEHGGRQNQGRRRPSTDG